MNLEQRIGGDASLSSRGKLVIILLKFFFLLNKIQTEKNFSIKKPQSILKS